MKFRRSQRMGRSLAAIFGVVALSLAFASPARADTSSASANAATLSLNGGTLLTTGTCEVSNDGTQPADVCSETPSLFANQTVLAAGVLAQTAVARPDGTSAACAGLVGSPGTIQIGTAGDCTVLNPGPSGGVTIDLGALAQIKADAILAQCVASSTGAETVQVHLVNATIRLLSDPLGQPIPLVSLPAPNTSLINIGPLLTVTLNEQPVPQADGQVTATALHVEVLGLVQGQPPLIDLTVGTVTCGPNAVTGPISIFAGPSLPVAAVGAAVVGALFIQRRRRVEA